MAPFFHRHQALRWSRVFLHPFIAKLGVHPDRGSQTEKDGTDEEAPGAGVEGISVEEQDASNHEQETGHEVDKVVGNR